MANPSCRKVIHRELSGPRRHPAGLPSLVRGHRTKSASHQAPGHREVRPRAARAPVTPALGSEPIVWLPALLAAHHQYLPDQTRVPPGPNAHRHGDRVLATAPGLDPTISGGYPDASLDGSPRRRHLVVLYRTPESPGKTIARSGLKQDGVPIMAMHLQ